MVRVVAETERDALDRRRSMVGLFAAPGVVDLTRTHGGVDLSRLLPESPRRALALRLGNG